VRPSRNGMSSPAGSSRSTPCSVPSGQLVAVGSLRSWANVHRTSLVTPGGSSVAVRTEGSKHADADDPLPYLAVRDLEAGVRPRGPSAEDRAQQRSSGFSSVSTLRGDLADRRSPLDGDSAPIR